MKKADIITGKIYALPGLLKQAHIWRFQDRKIVFTNGCFDILHKGHISLLAKAADMGNILIVGVNTDSSVKRLKKGPGRPINTESDRALLLASLFFVDAVVLFEEDTPEDLINTLLPDVLVKGGDYTVDTVVGAPAVLARGGSVEIVPTVEGYSTTAIEKKLGACNP